MPAQRFRTRPTEVTAIRWDGSNLAELMEFAGPGQLTIRTGQVQVRNTQERTWLTVPAGHWIVKGLLGEFYPCSGDALHAKYTEVTTEETPLFAP